MNECLWVVLFDRSRKREKEKILEARWRGRERKKDGTLFVGGKKDAERLGGMFIPPGLSINYLCLC